MSDYINSMVPTSNPWEMAPVQPQGNPAAMLDPTQQAPSAPQPAAIPFTDPLQNPFDPQHNPFTSMPNNSNHTAPPSNPWGRTPSRALPDIPSATNHAQQAAVYGMPPSMSFPGGGGVPPWGKPAMPQTTGSPAMPQATGTPMVPQATGPMFHPSMMQQPAGIMSQFPGMMPQSSGSSNSTTSPAHQAQHPKWPMGPNGAPMQPGMPPWMNGMQPGTYAGGYPFQSPPGAALASPTQTQPSINTPSGSTSAPAVPAGPPLHGVDAKQGCGQAAQEKAAFQPGPTSIDSGSQLAPLKKPTITIVVVGETGVGKTAFMSLLANVCAGRSVLDFRQEHNPQNESNLDQDQSQTNAAMMYTFRRRDGVKVKVLDTPGLCDTRGFEADKEHKRSIAEAIKAQVQTLDGVIIMANGTVERVGPGVEYSLHALASMFPRSIANNVGFMFTHVPDSLSFNFQSSKLPEELRDAQLWTMQNPLAQCVKYQMAIAANVPEKKLQRMRGLLQSNYETTMDTLNKFFGWLDERKPQPTTAIVDLYEMSTRIEAAIMDVLAQIDQREKQRADLMQLEADLDRNDQVMNINRQYETIVQRSIRVQNPTAYNSTLCTVPDCYSNCHVKCEIEFLMEPLAILLICDAFADPRGGRTELCTACGHVWLEHRNVRSEWGIRTEDQTIMDESAKQRFEDAQSEISSIRSQKERIEDAIRAFEAEVVAHEEQLGALCLQFQELVLSGSFSGHIASAVRMMGVRLSTMKQTGAEKDAIERMEGRIESLKTRLESVKRAGKSGTTATNIKFKKPGDGPPSGFSAANGSGGHQASP